jgi:flagellar hook assembly protein FlgD
VRSGTFGAGFFNIAWDGRNDKGELVPGGIYFYQLAAGPQRQARKLVVVR